MKKKLLIVVNSDWFFLSHRLPIAIEAQKKGYEVHVSARDNGDAEYIRSFGFQFHELPITTSGTNPVDELKSLWHFYKFYKRIKPDLVHHVTMKPVVYGSCAARFLKIPTLNAMSGMGYIFTSYKGKLLPFMVKNLLKYGWKSGLTHVIFQNPDDEAQMHNLGLLKGISTTQIKGSGVDLEAFAFAALPVETPINVVLPARLLTDKGVREFKEASVILKDQWQGQVRFLLAGDSDFGNPTAIDEQTIQEWEDPGYFEWIGFQKNMAEFLAKSTIVVLPSYREGLPKTLIEANAIGRPIVTTDAVGCRECVVDGENGFLVRLKDSADLAEKIAILLSKPELRAEMSKNARKFAEQHFSIKNVVFQHLELYNTLVK
ncbi:MAG: glycosyltransferase family 4 protein [Flavobacteriales bacterium]